jgi:hypothetical protein
MEQAPSEQFAVTAVVSAKPSSHPWVAISWQLLGFVPGLNELDIEQASEEGEVHAFPKQIFHLYKEDCDAYYHNLLSAQPKAFLICTQSEGELTPVLVTVNYDEAASFMETDHVVLDAALPDELCVWLERFLIAHYVPVQRKKRKRESWFDDEQQARS